MTHAEIVGKFLSTLPEDDDHPYRTGPWRPQTCEWDSDDLTVVAGELPADLDGVKLRMPGGEGWQFVGEALGANPTPLAFTEVYTALQTGAIDGQDNPLPADKAMKFYEVTDQIILTGHLVANNQFSISMSKWNSMNEEQQAKVQECAINFEKALGKVTLDQEAELVDFFKGEGLQVYEPDKDAFRNHVLDAYKASKYSADWPEGLLEKINEL